jgi:tetratricopeptide (TPR) repeat protein
MSDLQLDTLEAKGLIRLATFQPELEYLFRHALVQDTAYGSLLKQERRALHLLVGDALEDLYPERRGDLAAVLAMHFEQAGDADRAVQYLSEAARFAYDRFAIVEAFDLYSRAASLLPPPQATDDQATRRRRVEMELGRVKAGFSFLSEGKALEILEPLLVDVEKIGDPRLAAEVHVSNALLRQFKGERVATSAPLRHSLDRVAELAVELDDPLIGAVPAALVGLFQVFSGELREGIANLTEAAPLLAQERAYVGSSFALVSLAIGLARMGDFDKAEEAARQAADVAEGGDIISKLDSLIGLSTVRSVRGDLESAVPLAMQCTNLAEQAGATSCVVASNFVLGDAYMRQGNFGGAKIVFERGNEVANTIEQKIFRPSIAAYMRSNAASLGDFGPNARSFEEALSEARSIGDHWGEASVVWQRAETEAKKDPSARDAQQMLLDYEAAVSDFEKMGARPFVARALRDWGHALSSLGRGEEGKEKLRRALALFEEMGIEREARELTEELVT